MNKENPNIEKRKNDAFLGIIFCLLKMNFSFLHDILS